MQHPAVRQRVALDDTRVQTDVCEDLERHRPTPSSAPPARTSRDRALAPRLDTESDRLRFNAGAVVLDAFADV